MGLMLSVFDFVVFFRRGDLGAYRRRDDRDYNIWNTSLVRLLDAVSVRTHFLLIVPFFTSRENNDCFLFVLKFICILYDSVGFSLRFNFFIFDNMFSLTIDIWRVTSCIIIIIIIIIIYGEGSVYWCSCTPLRVLNVPA